MAFSEICRICLSVNVQMFVLKKTGLQNLYKTLTNSLMDEDEEPIIVCFICHARLIRCRRLQQQAIESNAVHEQLLAGGSMSTPKPHDARDKIEFTTIYHIDIRQVECDIENDCKDESFRLESVKVEEENFEYENSKFEGYGNHETDTAVKQEDLEIDAFEDRHKDSENDEILEQLLAGGSMSTPKPHDARDKIEFTTIYHIDIRQVECDIENDCKDESFRLESVKVEEENFEYENSKFEGYGNHETEQPSMQTNNFSKPCEKKVKSNSTDCNINDVRKGNLDLESPTIKSKPKLKKDTQPVIKKGKHSAKIMKQKKKTLKQSVNILTKNMYEASTKYIFECDILADHISHNHKTQKNSDAVQTQVEQTPVPQVMDTYNCDICEFKTSLRCRIATHLKAHVAKQVYCCNNCNYKCTDKGNFQRHMKIHNGEKPFSCNICAYRCISKSCLLRHMKIHTGEKPFSCNTCEYKCISKSCLLRHIKIHTGEKPFSCNICEYRCIRKNYLQTHMKKHTGEKPFSCNICEYRCITKSCLRRHLKIHNGARPFS